MTGPSLAFLEEAMASSMAAELRRSALSSKRSRMVRRSSRVSLARSSRFVGIPLLEGGYRNFGSAGIARDLRRCAGGAGPAARAGRAGLRPRAQRYRGAVRNRLGDWARSTPVARNHDACTKDEIICEGVWWVAANSRASAVRAGFKGRGREGLAVGLEARFDLVKVCLGAEVDRLGPRVAPDVAELVEDCHPRPTFSMGGGASECVSKFGYPFQQR